MGKDDYLLLGLDRVKDTEVLNAAYNDAQGLTADFNLNLLTVMNQELGADFDLTYFKHVAYFNEEDAQIEMYLESQRDQQVKLEALKKVINFYSGGTYANRN